MSDNIAGSAYIELKAKMDSLEANITTEVKKVGKKSGQQFSDGFSKALGPLKSAIISAVSVTAVVSLGKEIFTLASQVQQAQIAFEKLTGSAEKATKLLADIKTFAASTPFDQMGLIDGTKRLLAYGFEAQQIIPIMNTLGDAVAGVGGTQDTLNGVIVALGQMRTKGKLVQQEVNQIAERGIPIFEILEEKLGLTKEQLGDIGKQGINAAEAIPAILEGIHERFGGIMEEQAQTIQGRFSNLVDIAKITLADIGLELADTAGDTITTVADMLEENKEDIIEFAVGIADVMTEIATAILDLVEEVGEGRSLLFETLGDLFNEGEQKNADMVTGIRGDWTDLIYFFKQGVTAVIGAFRLWKDFILQYFVTVVESGYYAGDMIAEAFRGATNTVGSFFSSLFTSITNGFKVVINNIFEGVNWLGRQLNRILPTSIEVGQLSSFTLGDAHRNDVGKGAFDGMKSSWGGFISTIKGGMNAIKSDFKKNTKIMIDGMFNNYQKRLDATTKRNQKIPGQNTINTSLDGIFGGGPSGIGGGGSGGGSGRKTLDKEEKERQKEIVDGYKEINKAVKDSAKEMDKYQDKIEDISKKFQQMKEKATDAFYDIGNSIKELDKGQDQGFMKRYTDLSAKIEKLKRDNSGIADIVRVYDHDQLHAMGSDTKINDIDVDVLLSYKQLQEELQFVISKTTEEQRKQAEELSKLSDAERSYNEYVEKRAELVEKQNIAQAFSASTEASDIRLWAGIDEETQELKAWYKDQEDNIVDIVDFKNIQYAQDLFNKQEKLAQEQEIYQNKMEEEQEILRNHISEKEEMERQYTTVLSKEIAKQSKAFDQLIQKLREVARARRNASMAGGGGVGGAKAFGGTVKAGVPYLVGENFKPEVFVPSVSGSVMPVNHYHTSKNINVDVGQIVADNPTDVGDWMQRNLGKYM